MKQTLQSNVRQNKFMLNRIITHPLNQLVMWAWLWKRLRSLQISSAEMGGLFVCGLAISCCGVSALAQKPAAVGPVGQLLNVRGAVKIEHDGKIVKTQAATCDLLHEGDVVTIAPGASAQALLSSTGLRYALASGSKVQVQSGLKSLSGVAPKEMPRIGRALAMNRPGRAGATLLRGLGDSDGPSHPSPIGLVPAEPVMLRWSGTTEGSLIVRVLEADSNKIVYTETIAANTQEQKIPDGKLKPGVWYSWSVQDMPSDAPGRICKSLFRLPLKTDAAHLAALEHDATEARKADKDDVTPDILLAQGYADLGLFDKARGAYEAALKLRPDDVGIQKALENLNRLLNP